MTQLYTWPSQVSSKSQYNQLNLVLMSNSKIYIIHELVAHLNVARLETVEKLITALGN